MKIGKQKKQAKVREGATNFRERERERIDQRALWSPFSHRDERKKKKNKKGREEGARRRGRRKALLIKMKDEGKEDATD